MKRRTRSLLAVLALAMATATLFVAAVGEAGATSPAPAWRIESIAAPTNLVPGVSDGSNMYIVTATNIGGAATDGGEITVTDDLPSGFLVQTDPNPPAYDNLEFGLLHSASSVAQPCDVVGPPVVCHLSRRIVPGERIHVYVPLQTPASGPAAVTNHVTVSGGGATPDSATSVTPFDGATPPFQVDYMDALFSDSDGTPVSQAGSHPHSFRFDFGLSKVWRPDGDIQGVEDMKHVKTTLPPGFVVNPGATPYCTEVQLETQDSQGRSSCPDASAVGITQFTITEFGYPSANSTSPIYNMVPPPGSPASLAFNATGFGFFIHILGDVDPASGYSLAARTRDIVQFGGINEVTVDLWGNPSDPARDGIRGNCVEPNGSFLENSCPVPGSSVPYLTMPSACSGPLESAIEIDTWQTQQTVSASTVTKDVDGDPVPVTGCGQLDFDPTLDAAPDTSAADSPAGLDVELRVPQTNDLDVLATSTLKKAAVTLPEGMTINPSAANGLSACSSSQIGLTSAIGQTPIRFDDAQPACPSSSKLGTAEVDTPLLNDPLTGSVYVAKPFDNPFGSFLAIYVVVERDGALVKLAGHVASDPVTGRLTATFDDNPQLPFSSFKVNFFGGSRGVLRTPAACGEYSTTSELSPWSGNPPARPQDDYSISQSPSGACVAGESEQPNSPSFDAGTVSPLAGEYSPFVLNLRREDGTQQFSQVTVSPPPGLVAKLAGTPACSDAQIAAAQGRDQSGEGALEQSDPSCPRDSKVGTLHVAAGAGPAPFWAEGKVYLAGPYKGEPLSFAIVTPAVAGPFDLGVVVTRVAIHVDPITAQITAAADPIPERLVADGNGFLLDVRSVQLALDKPDFTLNGTSCDPTQISGSLLSAFGQSTPLSQRFQLAECLNLGFKPKMFIKLKGGTRRGKHPQLTVVLQPRPGDANIRSLSVAFPRSEFLENAHIRTVCTRPDFAADNCPARSIYGEATVQTPILDDPLTGHIYLRPSDNQLPDLVPDLRGPASLPVKVESAGRTDSVNGGIRNTFDFIPDAPFTKLVTRLQGGSKGLLVNSRNICTRVYRATVKYTAHNGRTFTATPKVHAQCKRKGSRRG